MALAAEALSVTPSEASAPLQTPPPAAAPATEAPLDSYLFLREHVRNVFDFNGTSLAGHAIGLLVVLMMFAKVAPPHLLYGWGGVFAVVLIGRLWLALRFAQGEPAEVAGLRRRLHVWQSGTLISSALWGAAAWLLFPYGGAMHQLALIIVVYTFCVACVPVLAPQFRLFVIFVLLAYVPTIARVSLQLDTLSWEAATVMAIAMAMTIVLGRNARDAFHSVISLKLRTQALATQLRTEKAVADAARQEAEVANRAKTQFFAAASHDLRQPLHAMGLFAEALRSRTQEPEVRHLVNSINESVDALEGLFSELLDITRIDSGGVEVNPAPFEMGTIFRKLKLHFEPAAFEKGLRLRFRGNRLIALADPLLVERICRNLVSNAIRYTTDGTVLVSCRRREGRLLLQVWDTGRGIGPVEQERVFEEFYQVPRNGMASNEQTKGLGLGLAIVRRLASLMGAPLSLRSEVGQGTVFSLELPLGKAVPAKPRSIPGKAPLGLTLDGKLIVIVEDEAAVREGLEVLLTGWGASITTLASGAATRVWLSSAPPEQVAPSLIIADYRLENGETGVAAIEALRRRFGAEIPAIVVTGSSMTGHDGEAQEHNFHLLIKPVLPNKLRAMIAFKLSA